MPAGVWMIWTYGSRRDEFVPWESFAENKQRAPQVSVASGQDTCFWAAAYKYGLLSIRPYPALFFLEHMGIYENVY